MSTFGTTKSTTRKDWIKFGHRGEGERGGVVRKGGGGMVDRISGTHDAELKSSNSLTGVGEGRGLHRRRPRQALYLRFNSRSGQINLQR